MCHSTKMCLFRDRQFIMLIACVFAEPLRLSANIWLTNVEFNVKIWLLAWQRRVKISSTTGSLHKVLFKGVTFFLKNNIQTQDILPLPSACIFSCLILPFIDLKVLQEIIIIIII